MGAGAGVPSAGAVPEGEALARLRRMWPAGSKCKIHSLQSAAGQHLNGLEAEVREVDEATGRLILRLQPGDDMSKWKKVKPENVHWEGVVLIGDRGGLLEEVRGLVCRAAGCPQAIEATLIAELQEKLREAQAKLSPEDFATLQSFAEQARSHASQWLMYHELRVKPDIKFDQHGHLGMADTQEKEMKDRMSSAMKKAYWDVAHEELAKAEPDFSFLLSRVEELIETMSGFLPVSRRAAFKERAVDMSMLRMQVQNKAFDHKCLMELLHRLGAALMELESPYQSARTKEWLDELDAKPAADVNVVSCLAHLFDKCDILRMEVGNFGLQQIRATKLRELEHGIFSRMIQLDMLSLDVTKSWLAASEHGGHVEIAVIKGMAKLLVQNGAIRVEQCPEPLRCDLQCLQDFQSGLQGVALLGLVAIVSSPFFPASTAGDDAKELFGAVATETEKSCPQLDAICKAVEDGLADLRHSKGEPPVDFKKLDAALQTLRNCLGEDVPAFRLLHERACGAFLTALGPPKQPVQPTSLGHTPWSLRYAADHLNLLVEKVWTFLGEHLRVYSEVLPAITAAATH